MPVSTLKPEVSDYIEVWQMMRDVIGGSRTVKAAGVKYLPMLSRMTPQDYETYKMRADFYDGTSRASMAMMGFLFRKPPEVNAGKDNADLQDFQDDATMTGKSLYDLIKDCSQILVDTGRLGVWVDWSDEEDRPYAMIYEAHDIINWQYTRRFGKMVLTRLVLHERINEENPKDTYAENWIDQWREFELSEDATVTITIWRKKKNKQDDPAGRPGNVVGNAIQGSMKYLFGTGEPSATTGSEEDYEIFEQTVPERHGQPLGRILFTFVGTDGPYPEITKPPLVGMAELNLSWYRTSADLENARHFIGVPTPYACGFITDGKPSDITLGSSRVWSTTETNAHCGFLQVTDNFTPLTGGLEQKKAEMSELGIQVIDTPSATKSPEAYATVALRVSAQSSGLTAIARALSQCMTDVLTHAAWYAGTNDIPEELTENINIKMNLDFMAEAIDAPSMTAMIQAFIQGAISFETLFFNLQQGEIIEDGVTIEEEKSRIEKSKKMMPQPPGLPGLPFGGSPAAPTPKPAAGTEKAPAPPKLSSK